MPANLPDPIKTAAAKARLINENREAVLRWPLQRRMIESPHLDEAQVISGLTAFHQERMAAVPPRSLYPEAQPWVDNTLTYQKELKAKANLTDAELAMVCSFGEYICFRGNRQGFKGEQVSVEKCRVAFVPDSDRGRLHVKNVDDPPTHWKRRPAPDAMPFGDGKLAWDGTGSGLHMDDEPDEIFPLDVKSMLDGEEIHDVPGAVEFLTRYGKFWSSANCVIHDSKHRSVSIEKCTRNLIQVHQPGPDGRSWCSGMVCRDKSTQIAKYQAAKRLEYRTLFNLPDDGTDCVFWERCENAERKLAAKLTDKTTPFDSAALIAYFRQPLSQGGLNKDGGKYHPDIKHTEYTLATNAMFLDENLFLRWQRDENNDFIYPDEAETYQF